MTQAQNEFHLPILNQVKSVQAEWPICQVLPWSLW